MSRLPVRAPIQIGDRVRSWDLLRPEDRVGRPPSYVEGRVTGIRPMMGTLRYVVLVDRVVAQGEEKPPHPDCIRDVALPPINGTPLLFGGRSQNVELIEKEADDE